MEKEKNSAQGKHVLFFFLFFLTPLHIKVPPTKNQLFSLVDKLIASTVRNGWNKTLVETTDKFRQKLEESSSCLQLVPRGAAISPS